VQVTYERGWEAGANGKCQRLTGDGIGQRVSNPCCAGPCRVRLRYAGGWEHRATRAMCLGAMPAAIGFAWWEKAAASQSVVS